MTIDNPPLTTRLYTGQEKDTETGLYYYKARYYQPNLGVFTSADKAQGLNRYAYAANNPLRFFDPTGHMVEQGTGGGGIISPLQYTPPPFSTYSPEIGATGVIYDTSHEAWFPEESPGFETVVSAAAMFSIMLPFLIVDAQYTAVVCTLGWQVCANRIAEFVYDLSMPPGAPQRSQPGIQQKDKQFLYTPELGRRVKSMVKEFERLGGTIFIVRGETPPWLIGYPYPQGSFYNPPTKEIVLRSARALPHELGHGLKDLQGRGVTYLWTLKDRNFVYPLEEIVNCKE